jgi:hypothetical protein
MKEKSTKSLFDVCVQAFICETKTLHKKLIRLVDSAKLLTRVWKVTVSNVELDSGYSEWRFFVTFLVSRYNEGLEAGRAGLFRVKNKRCLFSPQSPCRLWSPHSLSSNGQEGRYRGRWVKLTTLPFSVEVKRGAVITALPPCVLMEWCLIN